MLSAAEPAALAASASAPALIPLPQRMECRHGDFNLVPAPHILADTPSRDTAEYLAARLRQSTGYPLAVDVVPKAHARAGSIVLTTQDAKAGTCAEVYELVVAADREVY